MMTILPPAEDSFVPPQPDVSLILIGRARKARRAR
jgi:hypothetical protein